MRVGDVVRTRYWNTEGTRRKAATIQGLSGRQSCIRSVAIALARLQCTWTHATQMAVLADAIVEGLDALAAFSGPVHSLLRPVLSQLPNNELATERELQGLRSYFNWGQ